MYIRDFEKCLSTISLVNGIPFFCRQTNRSFNNSAQRQGRKLAFYSLLVACCTNSLTFNNCTLCPHCIYVFCIYLRTNSDLCHLQHKLVGFYNRDEKCLQRDMNWAFIQSRLSFVFKGLIKELENINTNETETRTEQVSLTART